MAMKVLLDLLKNGSKMTYMIDFGKSVTQEDMAKLLKKDESEVVATLLGYSRCLRSAKKLEVGEEDRAEAEAVADFVVRQGTEAGRALVA